MKERACGLVGPTVDRSTTRAFWFGLEQKVELRLSLFPKFKEVNVIKLTLTGWPTSLFLPLLSMGPQIFTTLFYYYSYFTGLMTRAAHGSYKLEWLFNYLISIYINNRLNQYLRTKNYNCNRKLKFMGSRKVGIRSVWEVLEVYWFNQNLCDSIPKSWTTIICSQVQLKLQLW